MSGIDNIIEMIKSKTEERERSIIADAEKVQREKLQQAEDRAKEKADKIVDRAEREATASLLRHEASLKLTNKHKILQAKEQIFNEIMEASLEEIGKIVKGKGYSDVVKRLAIEGGVFLCHDKIVLIFPAGVKAEVTAASIAKAISAATGQKTTVNISKETIRASGGVIIRAEDGSKWVDNTFEDRLERFESKIRDRITTILYV